MSADNGIYILNLKDQSRVIHTTNIEDLCWSFLTFGLIDDFVPTRIVERYAGVTPQTRKEAQNMAFEMEEEILNDDFCPILEYGIQSFNIDKTWDEVVKEAKELAVLELQSIEENKERRHDWSWETELLNGILEMKGV